jgi:transcriptional regulator with XRE-family HTH domain
MDPYSSDHAALGRAVRLLRGRLGISQEELADRCQIDRAYMGGIERGERNVSFAKVLLIRAALEVTLQELIAEYERELHA